MNPNTLTPYPDANSSSLAHLNPLPPGTNPDETPDPNPAPPPRNSTTAPIPSGRP